METFLSLVLGNAVAAGLLALGAATAGVFPFARRRPALRHGLWFLVLLKLVTPPLWSVPVTQVAMPSEGRAVLMLDQPSVEPLPLPIDSPEAGPEMPDDAAIAVEVPAPTPEPTVPPRGWQVWLLAIWGGGSLLTLGVAAGRVRRFRRLLSLAEPAPGPLCARVESLAGRLGLRSAPEVRQVPGLVSPLIWALGCRPRLIVPTRLWDRLDERQRDTLLVHELAHLKRRDHWVRGLELLVMGLYWWFPLVWIALRGVREAEEQCCDAWVVWAFPDAARTYAEALLETLDFLSGAGPTAVVAACGLGPVHHLKRRMTMILQGTTPRALTRSGLLAVFGLSATLLPISPTWAQRPEHERDRDREETPAFAPERPEARERDRDRDPGPRRGGEREREGDRDRDHPEANLPRLPRLEREGDRERESPEARLRKTEIRVFKQRKPEDVEKGPKRESPEAERGDRGSDERQGEIKRLKAEVELRREALREAEVRLAQAIRRLGGTREGDDTTFSFRDDAHRREGRVEVRVFEKHKDDSPFGEKRPEPPFFHREVFPRPDQEKRFAELEKRLERLQDEVKNLRKDAPERR